MVLSAEHCNPLLLRLRRGTVRTWLIVPVLLGLLGLLGCDQQAGADRLRETEPPEGGAAPDQISWNVAFTVYEDNRPRVRIAAALMEHYETEDSTYTVLTHPAEAGAEAGAQGGADTTTTRVRATLFDEAGDSSAVLTANRLIYYDDEDRFEARGRVVVHTTDGKTLRSEHLRWDEEARKIRTPGFVRITTANDRLQGYGLVADEDLSSYRLSNVTGETTVEDI